MDTGEEGIPIVRRALFSAAAALAFGLTCAPARAGRLKTPPVEAIRETACALQAEPAGTVAALNRAFALCRHIALGRPMAVPATRVAVEHLVPALVRRLASSERAERERAADALGYFGCSESLVEYVASPAGGKLELELDVIVPALERPECANAACVVRYVRSPSAAVVQALARMFRSGRGRDVVAVEALAEWGPTARRSLVEAMVSEDRDLRAVASRALSTVVLTEAEARAVLPAFDLPPRGGDTWSLVALEASAASLPGLQDRIVDYLDHPDSGIRDQAAVLVARIGPSLRRLMPKLHRLLLERRGMVGTAEAIERLGATEDMVTDLARVVADDEEQFKVRVSCLEALGRLGRPAGVALRTIERRAASAWGEERSAALQAARSIRAAFKAPAPPRRE